MPLAEDRNRGHRPPEPPPADPGRSPDGHARRLPRSTARPRPPRRSRPPAPRPQPVPTTGFGSSPTDPARRAAADCLDYLPAYARRRAPGSAVPATVKVACVLTWVFSGWWRCSTLGMLVALVGRPGPDGRLRGRLPGVAARQPRPGRAPAGPLGRLPDVPRLVRRRRASWPGSPGAGTTGPAGCWRLCSAASDPAGRVPRLPGRRCSTSSPPG